jgi:uncharacterized protein (DUF2132 family)
VPDLSAELRCVKHDPSASSSGRWLERAGPAATRIPAMYAVMARSVAARQRIGTVAVTAVGTFAGGGGFGITSLSLMSLEVIVGGMSQRPRVIDGQVTVRDVLDLTVAIDHNVVDGAPAARFAAGFSGTSGERRGAIALQYCLTSPGDQQAGCVSGRGRFAARLRRGLVRLAGVRASGQGSLGGLSGGDCLHS